MKEISTEELKQIQIQILDTVHDFCIRNHINYWLDSGTLIGAIRHNGYIPWDDDIDIGMLRDDFDRFMELFNRSNDRYKFYCIENNEEFAYAYGKVLDTETVLYEPDELGKKLSVNIDVFIYDNAPDDDTEVAKMYRMDAFYRACNVAHSQKKDYEKGLKRAIGFRLLHLLTMPFPKGFFAKKMSDNSKKYADVPTKRVGDFNGYNVAVCEKEVFDSFLDHEFEGKMYKIPVGYDKWLRAFYGDYMQLPPEEKRVSTHRFKAYWK